MTERDVALPEVLTLLPHRYPMLLVDRVTALVPGRHAEGVKRVTGGEWFAGGGVMPGALIVEALAQLSAAVLQGLVDGADGAVGYFMGLDGARFRGEARPGDELRLVVNLRQFRRGCAARMARRGSVSAESSAPT